MRTIFKKKTYCLSNGLPTLKPKPFFFFFLAFDVFVGRRPAELKAVSSRLPKFGSLCFSDRNSLNNLQKRKRKKKKKKATASQFIILIHKQSSMFMAGVMTCLWQHYVCFTTPLSSQVFTTALRGGCQSVQEVLECLISYSNARANKNGERKRCLAGRTVRLTGVVIKPSH